MIKSVVFIAFLVINSASIAQEYSTLVEGKFSEARVFSNGMAAVKKNYMWGFVNDEGNHIIPCKYDDVKYFSHDKCAVELDHVWFFINKQGEKISRDFERINTANEKGIYAKWEGKWGFMDYDLNVLVKNEYDDYMYVRTSDVFTYKTPAGKYGAYNMNGEEIIPPIYMQMSFYGDYFYCSNSEAAAFFDLTGKQVTPFEYSMYSFYEFIDGQLIVDKIDGSEVILNEKLEVIHDKLDNYTFYKKDLYITETSDEQYGVYNIATDTWELALQSKEIYMSQGDYLEFIDLDGSHGLMDIKGSIVVEPMKDCSFYVYGDVIKFGSYFKSGVFNTKTGFYLPLEYKEIYVNEEDELINVYKDRVGTVYDFSGKLLAENLVTNDWHSISERKLGVQDDFLRWGFIEFK